VNYISKLVFFFTSLSLARVRSDFLFQSRREERRKDNATKAEQKDQRVEATFDEQWSVSFVRRKEIFDLF